MELVRKVRCVRVAQGGMCLVYGPIRQLGPVIIKLTMRPVGQSNPIKRGDGPGYDGDPDSKGTSQSLSRYWSTSP